MRGPGAVSLALLTAACGRIEFDPRVDADPGELPDQGPDPGLIAHYTMDGVVGGTLVDATGNGHHGSCVASECPTVVSGIRGDALRFDGTLTVIRVPSAPVLEQLSRYTITLWARMDQTPGDTRCAFTKIVGSGTGNTWEICVDPVGQVFFSTYDGVANQTVYTTVALSTSSWRHVALQWDGTTERAYIDGMYVTELTLPKPTDAGSIVIGADLNFGSVIAPWWGALDDLRIYGRALSTDVIAALAVP